MNAEDPAVAQTIVAEYAAVLQRHDEENVYPASLDTLPYPKETIKTAIRTSLAALASTAQLTDELRDFLEIAYVSLADFVDAELAQLLREYRDSSDRLTHDTRVAAERVSSPEWKMLAQSGTLAGRIARTIADDTDVLRDEFRRLIAHT